MIQNGFHLLAVSSHVWGQITSVELHTFYNVQSGSQRLGFLNGDDTVFAHLVHGFRNQSADFLVAGGYGSNLCDALLVVYFLCAVLQIIYSNFNGTVDTSLQNHWICTGSDILESFSYDCLCQKGCSGSTVTGHIIGLGGNFFDQLCTHVLYLIFQLDFLCDGHTVIGNQWGSVRLLNQNVSSLRSQCNLNGVCQLIHT